MVEQKRDARLAVLIPTCRDKLEDMHLDMTFTGLAMQSILPHRVYVHDEGRIEIFRDHGIRMMWNLLARRGIETVYLRATERKGIALARKKLVEALREESLVLFLDDDIVMEPDAIANLLLVMDNDPSLGFVQGEKINLDSTRGHLDNINRVNGHSNTSKEPFPIYFGATGFLLLRREALLAIRWEIVTKFCMEDLAGEDIAISLMISDKFRCLGVSASKCWHVSPADSKRWRWDLSLDLLWFETLNGVVSPETLKNALPHLHEFLE